MVEMTRRACDTGRLRVAVSYAACVENPEWGFPEFVASTFARDDVVPFRLSDERDAHLSHDAEAIVAGADVVLIGPGCPLLTVRRFHASGAFGWLRRAHGRGASILGVSAGAIALCDAWAEWPDPLRVDEPFDGGRLVPCGGLVPGVVDCHDEHDQWGELELVAGMLRSQGVEPERALGIPTGSGLVVHPSGELEVLGEVFDASALVRAVA